jgi:hypothetical protein
MKKEYIIGAVALAAVVGGYFLWKSKNENGVDPTKVIDKSDTNKCDAVLLQDNYYKKYFPNGYPDKICIDNLKPYKVEFYNWTEYKYNIGGIEFNVAKQMIDSSGNEFFNYIPRGDYYVLKLDINGDGAIVYDLDGIFYQKLLK